MEKSKIYEHPKTGVKYLNTCDAVRGSSSSIAQSENNDCVVRAFAAVTEVDYDVAHDYVKRVFKRPHRKGTPRFGPIMSQREGLYTCGKMKYERMTNHDKTTYKKPVRYYCWEDYKYKYHHVEYTLDSKYCPLITTYGKTRASQMTVGTFLKEYNVGRYLIHVRSHAFAIVDGVVMGNLADARQLKCRIIDAYKFKQCE